ncbi:hypothetical protein HK102_013155 [Quaeritorhiza haematococci]|nr:hypothetical protein HK102_013155 [Quaeritorhiza haematococci]
MEAAESPTSPGTSKTLWIRQSTLATISLLSILLLLLLIRYGDNPLDDLFANEVVVVVDSGREDGVLGGLGRQEAAATEAVYSKPSPTAPATPTPEVPPPINKTAFIGIFTIAEKSDRRTLIRSTYLKKKPPTLDVFFIVGKPKKVEVALLLYYENQTYGDIRVLECEENMNYGKTYYYFKYLAKTFPNDTYGFGMKTDDDVWLELPNLETRLASFPRNNRTYFGRPYGSKFHNGMGYVLSWDLITWIGTDPYPPTDTWGFEDQKVADWLNHMGPYNRVDEEKQFYDSPLVGKGWSQNYTAGTILVHQVKTIQTFMDAADYFMRDRKNFEKLDWAKVALTNEKREKKAAKSKSKPRAETVSNEVAGWTRRQQKERQKLNKERFRLTLKEEVELGEKLGLGSDEMMVVEAKDLEIVAD